MKHNINSIVHKTKNVFINNPKFKNSKNNLLRKRFSYSYFKRLISDFTTKNSLLKKLLLPFTFLIILSLTLTGGVTYMLTKSSVTRDFKTSTSQILSTSKQFLDYLNNNIENTSMNFYNNEKLDSLFINKNEETKNNLAAILESFNLNPALTHIHSIVLYNSDNLSVSSDEKSITKDTFNKIKNTSWYKEALKKDGSSSWTSIHKSYYDSSYDGFLISHVRLLKNNLNYKNNGVLSVNITPDLLNSALSNTKIGKNGFIFIADKNGTILSHKDSNLIGKNIKDTYFKNIKNKTKGTFEYKDSKTNKKMYGVFDTSKETTWKVIAVVPKSDLLATPNKIGMYTLLLVVICILLSIIICAITTLEVTSPIKSIINYTQKLSKGNFNINCTTSCNIHEINTLTVNFNKMISNLKTMLLNTSNLVDETSNSANQLLNISNSISLSSDNITSAIQEIANGSTYQTEKTFKCVDISNDFNTQIENTIGTLNSVDTATTNSIRLLNESTSVINKLSTTSTNNSSSMNKVSNTILELNNNTKSIISILDKIDELSNQTNLLSLNASIEAARSGQFGKGFSVIANEIRKLSDESKKASLEIKDIINNVHSSIDSSLKISNEAQNAFKDELNQVNSTINSFELIKNSINQIKDSMDKASKTISSLDHNKDLLINNINAISKISENNTSSTEEVTATIEEQMSENNVMVDLSKKLNNKSCKLKDCIKIFKF